jgi:hypothetical protein
MNNISFTEQVIRIPNLPSGRMVDENGMPTEEELTFRQALLTLLQDLFGAEGLVPPAQTTANITAIAANQAQAQGASNDLVYTMQPGTLLYDSTAGTLKVNLPVLGVPTILTVTAV